MQRLIVCLIVSAAVNVAIAAEEKPADAAPKAAAEKPAYHLSPMIIKDTDAVDHFIYGEAETDFATMMDTLGKTFFALAELEGKNGAAFDYPAIFVYHGNTGDPNAKFKIATGFPVKETVKPVGDFKIKKLDGIRCASVYYTGSLEHIGKAYESLFGQLIKAGHKPTGETRELYLYWAGETSPNTVVELQAAIGKEEKK